MLGLSLGLCLGQRRRGGTPAIITADTAPQLAAADDTDTPADVFTTGSYSSSAGTISDTMTTYLVNGSSEASSYDLEAGDTLQVQELVTDSEGNSRTFATGVVTVSATAPASSEATQGNVTFPVAGTYATGNFANGPAYIVIPSGTATMSDPTPAETTIGGYAVNGAMVNPQANTGQGFDEREAGSVASNSYDAANKATFPRSVTAGDVIIKSVANADPAIDPASSSSLRRGPVSEYASCFILSEAPAPGSFSPASVGWAEREVPASYVVDVAAKVAALPSYDTTGHDMPSFDEIAARVEKHAPVYALFGDNPYGHEYMLPSGMGQDASLYGRYVAGNIHAAMLALVSDAFTTAQKERLYTALVSHGIQWFDAFEGAGITIVPEGGLYQYNFGPMALALEATGRSDKYAAMFAGQGANQRQAFQFTQGLIDQLAPHDSYDQPYTWRRRNLNAIDGNEFTIATYRVGTSGDSPKGGLTGMTVTNGTASALVVNERASLNIDASATGSYEFVVDDPTGFSANDTVWFVPGEMPSVGDYDWSIGGLDRFNQYNPNTDATYRHLNEWTGLVLSLKAMDIWDSSWDAIEGYVVMANQPDTPTTGWDFPDHHCTAYGTADAAREWEADFWASHAVDILGLTQEPSSVFDFSTAPAANRGTVTAITDGWQIANNQNIEFSAYAAWQDVNVISAGKTYEITLTFETNVASGTYTVISAANVFLTSVRDLNDTITPTAGVPATYTFTFAGVDDVDFIGIRSSGAGSTPQTWKITNISVVEQV